jgi:hypothetical protein
VGGVGYFYGTSIVDRKFSYEWDEDDASDDGDGNSPTGARLTDPKSLLTATPSRSFFPRGFYWSVIQICHSNLLLTDSDMVTGMKVSIFCISGSGTPISGIDMFGIDHPFENHLFTLQP